MNLIFLSADSTPMFSNGGWAVSTGAFRDDHVLAEQGIKMLQEGGLEEGLHYKIMRHHDNRLKRIVFHTDEAFIQAKMICS